MKMLDNSGYQLTATSIADKSALQDQPSYAVLATVARLRAFATLLCLDTALADELVTVTLLRASVAVECSGIDPSLLTWLFGRLRTSYYKEHAIWFNPEALQAAAIGLSTASQNGDVPRALAALTAEEREALVLVEAAGCSLREAARICRYPPVQIQKTADRCPSQSCSRASEAEIGTVQQGTNTRGAKDHGVRLRRRRKSIAGVC